MIRTAIAMNRDLLATDPLDRDLYSPPNGEVYEIGEDALRVSRFDRRD